MCDAQITQACLRASFIFVKTGCEDRKSGVRGKTALEESLQRSTVGDFQDHLASRKKSRDRLCLAAPTAKMVVVKTVKGVKVPSYFPDDAVLSAVAYKPRPGDVFVATYPKCGTTWAQYIAYGIFHDGQPPRDLAEFFEESPYMELFGADVIEDMPGQGTIKTHLPFDKQNFSARAKYIYVARNPYDVCVSVYYHFKSEVPAQLDNVDFGHYLRHFIDGTGAYGSYLEDSLLPWYTRRNDPNVLFLTYEDLHADAKLQVKRIADMLGKAYAPTTRRTPDYTADRTPDYDTEDTSATTEEETTDTTEPSSTEEITWKTPENTWTPPPTQKTPRPRPPPKRSGTDLAALYINSSIDWQHPPCKDFYKFVCSKYTGGKSVTEKIEEYTKRTVKSMLFEMEIPLGSQSATEKAAALFLACNRLASSLTNTEVHLLKRFLSNLGLDLSDMPYDVEFDVVDRVASMSLEFGVPVFVKFGLLFSPPDITDYILETTRSSRQKQALRNKKLLYNRSSCAEHWIWMILHYTSKTYRAEDAVMLWDNAPAVVGLLMDSSRLARHDARILIGWTLLRRLLPFALGARLAEAARKWGGGEGFEADYCYELVSNVMAMAVTHQYLKTYIHRDVVTAARHVVTDLMDTLVVNMDKAAWIQEPVRTMAVQKVRNMRLQLSYPEVYNNATLVEKFYAHFPQVGSEFFTPYMTSRRLVTIRTFRGHVNARYRPSYANAFYNFDENTIKIYAGILQLPVFIFEAPAAFNYGSLGQITGHELMHAFDVRGIAYDDKLRPVNFQDTSTMKQYQDKVLCIRAAFERGTLTDAAAMDGTPGGAEWDQLQGDKNENCEDCGEGQGLQPAAESRVRSCGDEQVVGDYQEETALQDERQCCVVAQGERRVDESDGDSRQITVFLDLRVAFTPAKIRRAIAFVVMWGRFQTPLTAETFGGSKYIVCPARTLPDLYGSKTCAIPPWGREASGCSTDHLLGACARVSEALAVEEQGQPIQMKREYGPPMQTLLLESAFAAFVWMCALYVAALVTITVFDIFLDAVSDVFTLYTSYKRQRSTGAAIRTEALHEAVQKCLKNRERTLVGAAMQNFA
ncbi:hypothetical protein V5799_009991 [Amblyomma americanum]|uniref:Uncharacterized protein n=1 Tax=Amblyomma americanum TaxID=6943 RepID=A0AAQ4F9B5_AMBAM